MRRRRDTGRSGDGAKWRSVLAPVVGDAASAVDVIGVITAASLADVLAD
jgi:hypothetical protein